MMITKVTMDFKISILKANNTVIFVFKLCMDIV